jgi:hypothetical protein
LTGPVLSSERVTASATTSLALRVFAASVGRAAHGLSRAAFHLLEPAHCPPQRGRRQCQPCGRETLCCSGVAAVAPCRWRADGCFGSGRVVQAAGCRHQASFLFDFLHVVSPVTLVTQAGNKGIEGVLGGESGLSPRMRVSNNGKSEQLCNQSPLAR